MTFRGVNITVPIDQYVCTVCSMEAGTVNQTADIQKAISEAYRKAVNLLTGKEIVEKRKKLNLTQDALAKRMNVGLQASRGGKGAPFRANPWTGPFGLPLETKASEIVALEIEPFQSQG